MGAWQSAAVGALIGRWSRQGNVDLEACGGLSHARQGGASEVSVSVSVGVGVGLRTPIGHCASGNACVAQGARQGEDRR
ncbi:hypothetical protein SAMN05216359_11255 [Roseateles sp. YR242]|nr:hypothetical protein SAMN05216359_11255 [Roseateles sp. YR242]